MKITKKNLLLIGPIPEPAGGVSIHIQRLGKLISPLFEINYIDESHFPKKGIFNIRSLNLIKYIKLLASANIVHLHSEIHLRIIHLFFCFILRKKCIVTIHWYSDKINPFIKIIHSWLLKTAKKVIVVNPEFIKNFDPTLNLIIKEAFIHPDMINEHPLPDYINKLIEEKKSKNSKILINNAWRLDFNNGVDLYGVDLCIELTKKLKNKGINVFFIFVIPDTTNNVDWLSNYKKVLIDNSLSDSFMFVFESLSFVRLIEESDIVYRTTNTDGDALTIRESIYLGKPVIASDVTLRPSNTILFKSREIEDLFDKTLYTLNNYDRLKFDINSSANHTNYLEFYKKLYSF